MECQPERNEIAGQTGPQFDKRSSPIGEVSLQGGNRNHREAIDEKCEAQHLHNRNQARLGKKHRRKGRQRQGDKAGQHDINEHSRAEHGLQLREANDFSLYNCVRQPKLGDQRQKSKKNGGVGEQSIIGRRKQAHDDNGDAPAQDLSRKLDARAPFEPIDYFFAEHRVLLVECPRCPLSSAAIATRRQTGCRWRLTYATACYFGGFRTRANNIGIS